MDFLYSENCPVLCNGNGDYIRGACHCHPEWKGQECEIPVGECEVPNCNGNGRCVGGVCECTPGYKGPHCGLGKNFRIVIFSLLILSSACLLITSQMFEFSHFRQLFIFHLILVCVMRND